MLVGVQFVCVLPGGVPVGTTCIMVSSGPRLQNPIFLYRERKIPLVRYLDLPQIFYILARFRPTDVMQQK